jgi:hypothetical protein
VESEIKTNASRNHNLHTYEEILIVFGAVQYLNGVLSSSFSVLLESLASVVW